MSPLYTRKGDDGSTGLLGEGRLQKNHPRIEALGTLDEASAALGLSRALCQSGHSKSILMEVQRDLYAIMAEIAATPENVLRFTTLDAPRVQWLESLADDLTKKVSIPSEFILPGDSMPGASLSLSRTIIRRAERRIVELLDSGEINNPIIIQYLNRLSSLVFVLELVENQQAGTVTTLAKK